MALQFAGWKKFLRPEDRAEQRRKYRNKEEEDVERAIDWLIANVKTGFKMPLDEMCRRFGGSASVYVKKIMKRAIERERKEGDIILYQKAGFYRLIDNADRRFAKEKQGHLIASGTGSIMSGLVVHAKVDGLESPRLTQRAIIVNRTSKLKDRDLAKRLRGLAIV